MKYCSKYWVYRNEQDSQCPCPHGVYIYSYVEGPPVNEIINKTALQEVDEKNLCWVQWCVLVILVTGEMEAGRSQVQGHPKQLKKKNVLEMSLNGRALA